MQIYSATFPVKETLTQDGLIELVIRWNQGSPHNKIENLEWDGKSRNVRFGEGNVYLAVEEVRAHNIIAIRFHQFDENNIIWNTDMVVDFNKHIFSIKIDRETTADTVDFIPQFKAPVIVNMLLKEGYIGTDLGLPISDSPILIHEEKYKIIEDIICKNKSYEMPIVYVTKYHRNTLVREKELAYRLRGVAHVFVEENGKIAKKLQKTCFGRDPYFGIYYPNGSYRLIKPCCDRFQNNNLIDKIVGFVSQYVNRQARSEMMTWEGVQNEILRLRFDSATEKRTKAESEIEAVYDSFGQELENNKQTIEELNNRVMALQVEKKGLRAKYEQNEETPLIYYGQEKDLYDREIKDHILDTIRDALNHTDKKTRKEHILQDILKANKETGNLDCKRNQIKIILKGYTKFNDKLKRDLKEFGFHITKNGGHYKLAYKGDPRYLFTIAAAGSDSKHGGGNLASEIKSKLL